MNAITTANNAKHSREVLNRAIIDQKAARDVCARSAIVLQQAREAAMKDKAAAQRYADLDQRIAKIRADQLKSGTTDAPLPRVLIEEREERRKAQDRAVETESVVALLEAEHEAANRAIEHANHNVERAVAAVMIDVAMDISNELRRSLQTTWNLRTRLEAFDIALGATTRRDGQCVRPPASLFDPLVMSEPQRPGNMPSAVTEAGTAWRTWRAALMANANAPAPEFEKIAA